MSKRVNLRPSGSGRVHRPYWNVSMKHKKNQRPKFSRSVWVSRDRSYVEDGMCSARVHMIHCREWACARGEDRRAHQNKTHRFKECRYSSSHLHRQCRRSEEEMRREKCKQELSGAKQKRRLHKQQAAARDPRMLWRRWRKKRHGTVC